AFCSYVGSRSSYDDQLNRIKCIRTKLNRPYRLDEDHMLKIRILLCGFLESMFKKSFD
ncbi:hypothetical protein ISN45_At03g039140, partial [Arabidopsis thaliana x Arabidopsis arenosa]